MTALPAVPPFMELQAPGNWRVIDFISDLHLQAEEPETFEAWRRFMSQTPADAVFILGDLFEVWVGDDLTLEPGFAADCAAVLAAASARASIFFMHGNRDFLVGEGLMCAGGATLLADPTVLGFQGRRWLLTHGDSLCLADTDYLRFRSEVRTQDWQDDFLSKSLAERQAMARDMRRQSEERKHLGVEFAEVDAAFASAWLEAADAAVMIHGHTHRPADHPLPAGRQRIVLSDWDSRANPVRQQALRLTAAGPERVTVI